MVSRWRVGVTEVVGLGGLMSLVSLMSVSACGFAIAACGPPTSGAACASHIATGELVITEVFASYKGSGGDAGHEWFELYNASDRTLDLGGLTIANGRPDGTDTKQTVLGALTIEAGAYVALGDVAPDQLPPYLAYGYGDALGEFDTSGAAQLVVACGSDELAKALVGSVHAGHARELTMSAAPAMIDGDDATSWCDASTTEFVDGNYGTPAAPSDCLAVPPNDCIDGDAVRPIVSPPAGALVITEVMANPAGTDAYEEWFEITNASSAAFDLVGLGLDRAGDDRVPDVIGGNACVSVAPGGLALFARDSTTANNGGLPKVDATFGFSIVSGSPASPGDLRVLAGTTVLDAVTWTHAPMAAASQLDPTAISTTANDDPAAWCTATSPYGDGHNDGTPRAANQACPAP
jgi:hypothetical protein